MYIIPAIGFSQQSISIITPPDNTGYIIRHRLFNHIFVTKHYWLPPIAAVTERVFTRVFALPAVGVAAKAESESGALKGCEFRTRLVRCDRHPKAGGFSGGNYYYISSRSRAMGLKEAVMMHMEAAQGGSILVRNEGGYVARFSVSYTLNGQSFTKDSGNFSLGVNASIAIPAGATDIHVKVEEMWGFGWSTIFTKNFDSPVTKCYKIYGTTLDPKWEEIAC